MQTPQIVERPALTVVGLEVSFLHALSPEANNLDVIGPLWDTFLHRVREIPERDGHAMYGVIYARPESERRHPDELQYIAAVAVTCTSDLPAGMVAKTIPANTFAVFMHRGPVQTIKETCREIYRDWLPQSAWQHAGIADVELYDQRFNGNADSEMEYWISVTPRLPPN